MNRFCRLLALLALSFYADGHASALSPVPVPSQPEKAATITTIRGLSVMGNGDNLEVEIYASRPVTPQTQMLSGPDRVVIDFPGALPGGELRGISVSHGPMKVIRVGLLQASPPVTRVVLDLKAPRTYQVLRTANKITVKVGSTVSADGISATNLRTQEPASLLPTLKPASKVVRNRSHVRSTSAAKIGDVTIRGKGTIAEIEIAASRRVIPQTQVLSGPDRLVVDFPGAVPRTRLSGGSVNRGAVKAYRMGLFDSNPPVTRLVFDLEAPQRYQIFSSGNTVIVKIGSTESETTALPASPPIPQFVAPPPPAPVPAASTLPVQVRFENGLLSVRSERATLAQVLYEVHRQTGADIAVPAGAEQETVVTDVGPGPAREVLASFLNGSHYNFIILGSGNDENVIKRVILSPNYAGTRTELNAAPNAVVASDSPTQPANGSGNPTPADAANSATAPGENPPAESQPVPDQRGETVEQPGTGAAGSANQPDQNPAPPNIPF